LADAGGSPGVTRISWGRVEIEGREGALRDAKLYPGGSREWDWNETGTRHSPGIGAGDVDELLERGAEVVVLSRGFHGRLGVPEETLRMLEERGVVAHVLLTEEAVRLYNDLRENERVGALIHSTC
jgi:hypothetical protein